MSHRLLPVLVLGLVRSLDAQQPVDTAFLPPVVVTATRLPTPADDVPQAITVLRHTELAARGISTVLEALRAVPSAMIVQTGSFGGQTSLFLRGGESDYVKVLVDGVPVNQPGGAYDFANLATTNVDRIEILRGPASVLYGSDAVTGVVQIFTQRGATGQGQAQMALQSGTYGTVNWIAAASGGSERAGYSLAVSRQASDGIYAFNNQYDNTVGSVVLRAAPDARSDALLSVRYNDATYHFPTNGAGVATDPNQFNYGKGPTVGVDLGRRLSDVVEARLLLTENATEGGYDNQPDTADSSLFHSLDKLRRTGAELRANVYVPGGQAVLTAGTAFEAQHDQSSNACQFSGFDCSTPPVENSRSNWAWYLQGATVPKGRVSLTGGVRLEDNQRFGTYGTYRLGAAYRVASGTRVRATLGNGFREPTFFENYSTGFTVGNPDLRPEHSASWELGLEQTAAGGRIRASVTLFDQRFRDMIDYNPAAAPGAPNYQNIAAATARGAEFGLGITPGRLALSATYTALYTRATSAGFDSSSGGQFAPDEPLLRRPADAARADLDYHFPGTHAASVSLAVTYVGSRQDQDFSTFPAPRVTLPSWTRYDVVATIDVVRSHGTVPGLTANARVENLFDLTYEPVKNFPAPRRTMLLGARLSFAY